MTLQQRIQESAAELGKLLRQAEKQHRRFLKRRDARMRVSTPWTPDGHPLVFIVRESGIDVAINSRDLATRVSKALAKLAPQTQSSPVSTSDASPLSSVVLPSGKGDCPPDNAASSRLPADPGVGFLQDREHYQDEVRRTLRLAKRLRADMARFARLIAESAGSSR